MSSLRYFGLLLFVGAATNIDAAEITLLEADAQLRQAYALARETNDLALLEKINATREHVKKAFDRKDQPAVRFLLHEAQELVGLDRDGRTMFGLPVAQLTGKQRVQLQKLTDELNTTVAKGDAPTIQSAVQKIQELLGDQAGVPDAYRKTELPKGPLTLPSDKVDVFIKTLIADPASLRALQQGAVGSQTLPRAYASVVLGCLPVRALLPATDKERRALLDSTITGCCKSILQLQLKSGFIKYPDLRDKNLQFTEIIDGLVAKDINAVQEGFVVLPDPGGETHQDVGECGIALLLAGVQFQNDTWKQAGLLAANWMEQQPPCAVAHHNASMVSLLCAAYRVTHEEKYRTAAWTKYRLGIAPGQVTSGRWLLPLDARSSAVFVIVRALHDLAEISPDGPDRSAVLGAATKALNALDGEMTKLLPPVSGYTLQELERHAILVPDRAKDMQGHIKQARTLLLARTWRAGRAFAVVPLPELAAAIRDAKP